jgi:LacI family transcriptional regulator
MTPRYIQIREAVAAQIESGELAPGQQVPPLRELCQQYGVSTITARRALLELMSEGLVESRLGIGAFVTGKRRAARVAVVIIGYEEASWRVDGAFFGQLVGGIASAAWKEEANLSIVPINDAALAKQTIERLLRDEALDGLLFRVVGDVDWSILDVVREHAVEAVLIKRLAPGGLVSSVVPDSARAGLIAVERLLKEGHRHFALVATTVSPDTYREHRAGFEAAIREAGLTVSSSYMPTASRGSVEEGVEMTTELLRRDPRPTAIVTNSDFLAAGVYEAVAAAGLTIPDDVSVVSFDDLEFAAHLTPALTTVRLSYYDLGRASAVALFRSLRGEEIPVVEIVSVDLVDRGSVAPPPGVRTRAGERRSLGDVSPSEEQIVRRAGNGGK